MSKFFLTIQGIASEATQAKILSAVNKIHIPRNCLLVFCDYSDFDIPIGSRFVTLTLSRDKESHEVKAELKFVTQNQGILFDAIPKGHRTICEICFDDASLKLMTSKIPKVDSWKILPVQSVLSGAVIEH
jgi:hypothetical protein